MLYFSLFQFFVAIPSPAHIKQIAFAKGSLSPIIHWHSSDNMENLKPSLRFQRADDSSVWVSATCFYQRTVTALLLLHMITSQSKLFLRSWKSWRQIYYLYLIRWREMRLSFREGHLCCWGSWSHWRYISLNWESAQIQISITAACGVSRSFRAALEKVKTVHMYKLCSHQGPCLKSFLFFVSIYVLVHVYHLRFSYHSVILGYHHTRTCHSVWILVKIVKWIVFPWFWCCLTLVTLTN